MKTQSQTTKKTRHTVIKSLSLSPESIAAGKERAKRLKRTFSKHVEFLIESDAQTEAAA